MSNRALLHRASKDTLGPKLPPGLYDDDFYDNDGQRAAPQPESSLASTPEELPSFYLTPAERSAYYPGSFPPDPPDDLDSHESDSEDDAPARKTKVVGRLLSLVRAFPVRRKNMKGSSAQGGSEGMSVDGARVQRDLGIGAMPHRSTEAPRTDATVASATDGSDSCMEKATVGYEPLLIDADDLRTLPAREEVIGVRCPRYVIVTTSSASGTPGTNQLI